MEQTECSETSAYEIQTPGNCPEESIQHSEQGESLKSRGQIASELPADEGFMCHSTLSQSQPVPPEITAGGERKD